MYNSVALDEACGGKCEVLKAQAHVGSTRWLEVSGQERCIGPELGGNRTMLESTFKSESIDS